MSERGDRRDRRTKRSPAPSSAVPGSDDTRPRETLDFIIGQIIAAEHPIRHWIWRRATRFYASSHRKPPAWYRLLNDFHTSGQDGVLTYLAYRFRRRSRSEILKQYGGSRREGDLDGAALDGYHPGTDPHQR